MKLSNRSLAGQKLSLSSGIIVLDADGCIDTEDKAIIETLQRSGFKPVFVRKDKSVESKVEPKAELKVEPKEEVEEEAEEAKVDLSKTEALSTLKVQNKKKGKY